jgi:signal transduction histidine kinase
MPDVPAPADRVNILLVDDQPAKLLSYEVILRELGENLVMASSAREALEHLLKIDIAVILVDVHMPEMDGFELVELLRQHPRFEETAVIFVSGIHLTDLDRLRGYQVGAVDYVPVPVVPELLRAKVRVFAELYRKTRQLEKLNAELERRVAERTSALELANARLRESEAELQQSNEELERRVEERTREREAAKADLLQMQKLESLGQLTGGVAHDFNNLLMAMLGSLELLKKRVGEDEKARRLVDNAIQGAERGAALTQRMLAFARRQDLKPETVDVAPLIEGMTDLLRRSIGPNIEIETRFGPALKPALVDATQLELALLNLGLNARDAMPDGGRLRVCVENATAPRQGGAPDALGPGDYVRILVEDSGIGMDEATLARAVEPFFTTKGIGKGTGLGLSVVHGLVTQLGGAMAIRSRAGQGTTVELWLPVGKERPAMTEQPAPQAGEQRRCRVLLVEDDALIMMGTTDMLEDLGHEVLQASSAAEALDVLEKTTVDLMITDHAMPGMNGSELATRCRQRWSDLPIILATGYVDFPAQVSGTVKLTKPYRQAELAAQISALVPGAGGGAASLVA